MAHLTVRGYALKSKLWVRKVFHARDFCYFRYAARRLLVRTDGSCGGADKTEVRKNVLRQEVTVSRKSISISVQSHPRACRAAPGGVRVGAASLDYILLMAVVLPMVGFVLWIAPRIMNLVYEMTCVLVSWTFL